MPAPSPTGASPSGKRPMSSGWRRMNRAAIGVMASIMNIPSKTHAVRHPNSPTNHPAIGAMMKPPVDMPIVPMAMALPRFLMNHLEMTAGPTS